MNDLDEIEFRMFQVVFEIMTKYKSVWQANANITYWNDQLLYVIRMLKAFNETKQKNPKEITKAKVAFRKAFIIKVFNVKTALSHYYKNKEMKVDEALFNYTISKLTRMTDDALYMEASAIYERAVSLEAELLPLGITAAQITELDTYIKDFLGLLKKLEYALKNDIVNNAKITAFIKKAKIILKEELDDAVSMYSADFPDFTNEYHDGRKRVLKPGKHHPYKAEIWGKVTNAITKEGIAGVKVEAGAQKIVTTTDKDGNYLISLFKKDMTTISFSLPEKYIDKILPIPTKYKRSKIKMNIELSPIIERGSARAQYYID